MPENIFEKPTSAQTYSYHIFFLTEWKGECPFVREG